MTNARFITRPAEAYRSLEQQTLKDLGKYFPQLGLDSLALYTVYELFNATERDLELMADQVLALDLGNELTDELDLGLLDPAKQDHFLGIAAKEGQFDQRADAALENLRLLEPDSQAVIRTARLYAFETAKPEKQQEAAQALASYLLNPIVEEIKDFSRLALDLDAHVEPLRDYSGFNELDAEGLEAFIAEEGLAMSPEDLKLLQEETRKMGRAPSEVEVKVLDTYWSDHCRHQTFYSKLSKIENRSVRYKEELDRLLVRYEELRQANNRADCEPTLMDLATIAARELKRQGKLDRLEVSDEINACSIYVDVDTPQGIETWLLMFKNETHNHPTEIEPFGGAGTCLGGGIRDPLSGRAYVYQACRISGAGNIATPFEETLPGKLPQALISSQAAKGYSDYGNQIGIASTGVRELVHPGYVAKRMELGAVMAAAPRENVRRVQPSAGDIVVLVGARTGRDGVGGATGSSQAADRETARRAGSEVQKGNPPAEAGILRLFRRPEVAKTILKCNDFGAGGVSVAVGELADSLDIDLDKLPCKYPGLNAMELAISESQERMACLIAEKDREFFLRACLEEDLEATVIAKVTDSGFLRMSYRGQTIFELSRAFIEQNGADRYQEVVLEDLEEIPKTPSCVLADLTAERLMDHLALAEHGSQPGLAEQFDFSVGRSTVFAPYGGSYQKTPEQVSVQTLPVEGGTSTVSVMTYGYSPALAERSPYIMGAYSVIEALSKLTAAGLDYRECFLSNQEFFRSLDDDPVLWGRVTQSLLGLLEAETAFGLASVGGKDSMSGSFEDLNVPDTLLTFAFMSAEAEELVSGCLPEERSELYYLPHQAGAEMVPNYEQLKANFAAVRNLSRQGKLLAAAAIRAGGLTETLAKMCLGNRVEIELEPDLEQLEVFANAPGGIVIALEPNGDVPDELTELPLFYFLGESEYNENAFSADRTYLYWNDDLETSLDELEEALTRAYRELYPLNTGLAEGSRALSETAAQPATDIREISWMHRSNRKLLGKVDSENYEPLPVKVLIPVFYGQNGYYDLAEAFRAGYAEVELINIRRLSPELIKSDRQAFIKALATSDVLALGGSYHLADYPASAAQYMGSFLGQEDVLKALVAFVQRDGLILGIDNGFQALVQCGLLPYGLENPKLAAYKDPELKDTWAEQLPKQEAASFAEQSSVRFAPNPLARHTARLVETIVRSNSSPWFFNAPIATMHYLPYSTSWGQLLIDPDEAEELFERGQIAAQYCDPYGSPSMEAPWNPSAAEEAIEAITSPCGRILGKMTHPERSHQDLFLNVPGNKEQDIFRQAVYFVRLRKGAKAQEKDS